MDSSFNYAHVYQPRSARNIEGFSQTASLLGVPLKHIEMPCSLHPQEQSSNYCIESKCHQPLCSECIEEHLLHHKKQGFSDLAIKSLRGVRKECIKKLAILIEDLVRRLGSLQAPIPPEQQLENLQNKLESVRLKMHEIIQEDINRLKESLRRAVSESANYFKSMAQIHAKLQDLIQQLRQNHATLVDGGKKVMTIPDCIKKTLTLDQEALLDSFQKEGAAYEARRCKADLQVLFQPDVFRNCILEAVKVVTPQSLNTSTVSSSSRLQPRFRVNKVQQEEQVTEILLPTQVATRGNNKLLHFFQTGSNKVHLISIENRKKGLSRAVSINQFVVPSFHASLISQNGQFIFLSGGIVELNGGAKSPLFIRYSVRTQVCKKDFAKVRPRSSHSLCEDSNGDIYILGGYGPSEHSGGDPSYEMGVERVNPRSGRAEIETSSNWGGSNISMFCSDHILKACEEGIEIYSIKSSQWIIAEIKTKPKAQYVFFKNAGYASLNDRDILIFGGYNNDSVSSDLCFLWKVAPNEKPKVNITKLRCKLPIAQGFQNCGTVIDDQGVFVLQNVEDDEQFCVDNERRLLRFDLNEGSGDWKTLQIANQL